jgi:hypothetical protein
MANSPSQAPSESHPCNKARVGQQMEGLPNAALSLYMFFDVHACIADAEWHAIDLRLKLNVCMCVGEHVKIASPL